jgi:hypothetical protein
MNDKHDLKEYAFSREVVKDFPIIKKELANLAKMLYGYRKYACVAHVLSAVQDSLLMLKRQQDHYEKVYRAKGKE